MAFRMDRRHFLQGCAALGGLASTPVLAKPEGVASAAARLLREYAPNIDRADMVGIVDFSAPSWRPRFHLVEMKSRAVSSYLVAHGRGSDPSHSGWLRLFSNEAGSNATSRGAYRTASLYEGKYGRSMRLVGLGADNSNAEARAIVIHPAWYVGDDMLKKYGKLGRSEGCFAVAQTDLDQVLDSLSGGCLLYAAKF